MLRNQNLHRAFRNPAPISTPQDSKPLHPTASVLSRFSEVCEVDYTTRQPKSTFCTFTFNFINRLFQPLLAMNASSQRWANKLQATNALIDIAIRPNAAVNFTNHIVQSILVSVLAILTTHNWAIEQLRPLGFALNQVPASVRTRCVYPDATRWSLEFSSSRLEAPETS
ncbi:hypothetical protein VTL71DRAFT_13184 [Oculimacula yallundae]|uniref:Uncharacterized protein n=1 Tax=Oculimacula yallundae TaxID=86028 RepID=A0ABR4CJM4_9HELO